MWNGECGVEWWTKLNVNKRLILGIFCYHRFCCSDWKFLALVYGRNGACAKYFNLYLVLLLQGPNEQP